MDPESITIKSSPLLTNAVDVPLPPVPRLIDTNYAPTNNKLRGIREVLAQVRLQMAQIDHLLATAQQSPQQKGAIKMLSIKRDALITFDEEQSTFASGLRRLPAELLSEIFTHCCISNMDSYYSANYKRFKYISPPSALASVCQFWRNVAISTPIIWWQNLVIYMTGNSVVHLSRPVIERMPKLISLEFRSDESAHPYVDHPINPFKVAPNLRYLVIPKNISWKKLSVPWHQLKKCEISCSLPEDPLEILMRWLSISHALCLRPSHSTRYTRTGYSTGYSTGHEQWRYRMG